MSPALEPVIGLEIHVQLATRTKMFCGCELAVGREPNSLTCPVCLGHPGTLPTLNGQAVEYCLMIAAALECEVPAESCFHRKNYFYPDLPKGYQISQYDKPMAVAGRLGEVRVHRAHLEEDAAKLTHVGESGRIHGSGASIVDFNRGGTPLVEIVTEPDIESAAQAREWAQLLRATLRSIRVSDCNMEEGSLRVDANVSLRPEGSDQLGVKTELKNMNSFRFLERGIEAEIERQRALLANGQAVEQQTLHFHPEDGSITPLRSKEYAHDYRYFPEPDLVPVAPTAEMLRQAREALPELPVARQTRYAGDLGLSDETATILAFTPELGDFFDSARESGVEASAEGLANWITGELVARIRDQDLDEEPAVTKLTPQAMAGLVGLVESGAVSHGAAKEVLAELVADGGDPAAVVEARGLGAIGDDAELEKIVEAAIAAEPDAAEEVRAGNEKAVGRIVGAAMRESGGRADGGRLREIVLTSLRGG